jgi:hypothetical protein
MRSLVLSTALLVAAAPAALAQAGGHGAHAPQAAGAAQRAPRPDGWAVRYDRANAVDSTLAFTAMAPGWHVATGPSAILWDSTRTASGDFAVTSEMFLFPGERAEGFGIFVGGRDLAGAGQQYTYFLLRRNGMFTIKRRDGATASTLVPWTAHPAIETHTKSEGTVKYALGVVAGADSVRFTVNGTEVAALPRATVAPDGVVGLRVNHALNLHVTSLDVRRR